MSPAGHASPGKKRALVKWHGSCIHEVVHGFVFCKSAWTRLHERHEREVLMERARNEIEYDLNSAITFLLVGLGIGAILAMVFDPKQKAPLEGMNGRRTSGLQPRRQAQERVA